MSRRPVQIAATREYIPYATREPASAVEYNIPVATREPGSAAENDPTTDVVDVWDRLKKENVHKALSKVQETYEIDNSEKNTDGFKENSWKTSQENIDNCKNYWFKNDPAICISTRNLLNYPGRTNKRKRQNIYSIGFRKSPLHAGSRKRRRRTRKHTLKR